VGFEIPIISQILVTGSFFSSYKETASARLSGFKGFMPPAQAAPCPRRGQTRLRMLLNEIALKLALLQKIFGFRNSGCASFQIPIDGGF
jgi:hypothetical protein